jgi:hypothetical protein
MKLKLLYPSQIRIFSGSNMCMYQNAEISILM